MVTLYDDPPLAAKLNAARGSIVALMADASGLTLVDTYAQGDALANFQEVIAAETAKRKVVGEACRDALSRIDAELKSMIC